MRLSPNLAFGGQCGAAFKFYEQCFGGKIVFMLTYGKSPMADKCYRDGARRSSMRLSQSATTF